jgi:hypothetical protein
MNIDIWASAHNGYMTHKFGLHVSRTKGSLLKGQRSYSPITIRPNRESFKKAHISGRAHTGYTQYKLSLHRSGIKDTLCKDQTG